MVKSVVSSGANPLESFSDQVANAKETISFSLLDGLSKLARHLDR